MPTLAELQADMEASDAEIEAGQIVPADVIHQDLLDCLARMKAKRDCEPGRGTAQRR